MVPNSVVVLANLLQSSVPILSLLAYVPQWTKLVRSRNSGAMSARSWLLWTLTSLFSVVYAVVQLLLNGRGWALVFSSATGLIFVSATLLMVVRFRPRQTGTAAPQGPR